MFGNLGLSEILIIAAIALVALGPEKFPEFVKIALRAYRDFRGYIDDIKKEMAEELHPIKKELQQLAQYNPEDYVEKLAQAVVDVDKEPEPSEPKINEDSKQGSQEGGPAPSVEASQTSTPPPTTEPHAETKTDPPSEPTEHYTD